MSGARRVVALDRVGEDLVPEERILAPLGITIERLADAPEASSLQLASAEGLLANRTPIGSQVLNRAPACRGVVTYGVGFDHVDLAAARSRGITVANVTDYCSEEVADHTVALMLAVLRGVVRGDDLVRRGGWGVEEIGPIHRLRGRTVGLVGYGRIARAVHQRVMPFGMPVIVYDPLISDEECRQLGGRRVDSLKLLLASADIVSLHVPLNDETALLVDADALAGVKHDSVLINTSRGGLVDSQALLDALTQDRLVGAGLDVFPDEPPDARLFDRPNLVLTPHIAFYSRESIEELKASAAAAMGAILTGGPLANRVA
jgi:D-3-phosphoglycerate dehydrogenase / 2-oxoglutarate reductase